MKDDLLWIIMVPALLALAIGALFSLFKRSAGEAQKRNQRMRRLARGLGLRYYGSPGSEAVSFLPSCSLFESGQPRTLGNLMGERKRPARLLLFDYERTSGLDDRASQVDWTALHLVAMARVPGAADLVPVRIYQADWFGGPAGVKNLYQLQLETDPTFSHDYWLVGEPRDRVASMLTEPLRNIIKSWSEGGPKPVIEIVPGWVVVHAESHQNDKKVAQRGGRLLSYAADIARQLGAPVSLAQV